MYIRLSLAGSYGNDIKLLTSYLLKSPFKVYLLYFIKSSLTFSI